MEMITKTMPDILIDRMNATAEEMAGFMAAARRCAAINEAIADALRKEGYRAVWTGTGYAKEAI